MSEIKRVIIIGIDGAGNFLQKVDTPHLDRFFAQGAVTFDASADYPSGSAENWGAAFHGVSCEKHGVYYENINQQPFSENSAYPSFFKVIQQHEPQSKLAAFSSWEPINSGLIEQSSYVAKVSKKDELMMPEVLHYIHNEDPRLLFIHLGDVDYAGHDYGFQSEQYYQEIQRADGYFGQLMEAITARGWLSDSVVIVLTDHGGGGVNLKDHGSDHPLDMTIFWSCAGPGIRPGQKLASSIHIMDTAAVVLHAFGIAQPETWDARVPQELFQ
ncbi:alkaline phosphatase family protein [Paenibacillus chungangensis]|uniref:Alkaline phosphatase family protein n=1 Tax=Paenibacillus chungangensis TaxID=696535 RepID=A0ABW3HL87_9BACL